MDNYRHPKRTMMARRQGGKMDWNRRCDAK